MFITAVCVLFLINLQKFFLVSKTLKACNLGTFRRGEVSIL